MDGAEITFTNPESATATVWSGIETSASPQLYRLGWYGKFG
ncbi:9289_t:CDS:2 [Ambispora gerdemannii]|uniref:9289_t:CDS:1 n=1 Tax=Ambispora gerdemannii TaxID=144530 RepID=A0A9N8VAG4_9GLOM|nr:9289_t:CDS:2 [Ambispora gerdemannii]